MKLTPCQIISEVDNMVKLLLMPLRFWNANHFIVVLTQFNKGSSKLWKVVGKYHYIIVPTVS